MYKGNSILALVTARGGSKGITSKNTKLLGGKPLMVWTIDEAQKSRYIDRLILSSDDDSIIKVALEAGCEVPFQRPSELAQDTSTSMDVIIHALNQLVESYDYMLLLQPTSPFRTVEHIDAIIEQCFAMNAKMMISVSEVKKHPAFLFDLQQGHLVPILGFQEQLRRQDMPKIYEHNGALYLANTVFLRHVQSYNVPEAQAFIMDRCDSIDIDEIVDWEFAEFLISKGHVS